MGVDDTKARKDDSLRRWLFKIKPLEAILQDAETPELKLKRAIGPLHLIMLGIGAIIGAGIFATIGTAAAGDIHRPGAGPALMLSFIITAVVCGFTALCYAEFASMVPIAGSAYTYSYATLGELIAWIIGWDLIIEYSVGNIAVAISWANYFKTFLRGFGIIVPDWLSMDYRTASLVVDEAGRQTVFQQAPQLFGVPIVFNLLAMFIVFAITVILVWGIRESASFNAGMVAIKIVVLIFFIVIGIFWVQPENWQPFSPNGWAGISAGAAIVFFAYIGFDAISTVAEETRDPQKNLPIGIIGSLIICTIFYVVVSAIFTGLISFSELKGLPASELAEPLTVAISRAAPHLGWAVGIVAFGSVVAQTAVLLVFQLGQPRIFFAMSRDGLLPPLFQKVHPRFQTPHLSTILTGVSVAVLSSIFPIDEMVDLTNIGTLFAFILVCLGIMVLRIKEPDRPRKFRVPSGWLWTSGLYILLAAGILWLDWPWWGSLLFLSVAAVVFVLFRDNIFPVLGILSSLYLIYYLPPKSWLRFAAWMNFGFVVYATYGAVRSRLTGRSRAADPAAHDLRTSWIGTILLLAGVALLIIMHAFDVWLIAYQPLKHLPGLQGLWTSGREIWKAANWLVPSFFFIAPLILNALVLSPVLIRRAWRVQQSCGSGFRSGKIEFTLLVNSLFIVLTIAYLALLDWRGI